MSAEELRGIHDRVDRLQMYIKRIPAKVGVVGLTTKIDAVCAVFPQGRHYDHIVADLQGLLPETIDDRLREVEQYCEKLGEPWRAHIVGEVTGILAELRSFRTTTLLRRLKSLEGP
jgi:hypothetical protein